MSDSECSKSKRIKLDDSSGAEESNLVCNGNFLSSNHCIEPVTKKICETKAVNEEKDQPSSGEVNFMSFSDDVLLLILKNLKPIDLISVSRCCKRLQRVCKDFTLWEKVDFSTHGVSAADLLSYLQFLLPSTKSIQIKGLLHNESQKTAENTTVSNSSGDCDENLTDISTLSSEFLASLALRCPKLEELSVEYCYIDAKKVRFEHFPQSLSSVSLRNSCVINLPSTCSYFSKIDEYLPNLTVLDLSYCSWFVPHSLLAISKCHSLRELRLQGCKEMGDCVPYASLASSFGFGALQKLDLRLTPMGDSEVSCFNKTRSLTHLYLEAPVNNDPSGPFCDISDRTVTAFGSRERVLIDPLHPGFRASLLPIMGFQYGNDLYGNRIQVLVLRNYRSVTDLSLKHAAKCMPSLEYLDITGCGCTPMGIKQFKSDRPNVTLVHSEIEQVQPLTVNSSNS
nr:PREDICTED: uncharacterized protein LOC109036656 [Bemisia tabaci]